MIYNILIVVGFAIYEAAWRRTYGGNFITHWWKEQKWLNWLSPRAVLTVINLCAVFAIGYFYRNMTWYYALILTGIFELFWALAHGPWFDMGRGGYPDEKMLKRYNKGFYHYILDWCFPPEHRYSHFYDFCGMWLRYSWMLPILLIIPNVKFGMFNLGTFVTIVYGICHVAKDKNIIKKLGGTQVAELICGFITGLFICLA